MTTEQLADQYVLRWLHMNRLMLLVCGLCTFLMVVSAVFMPIHQDEAVFLTMGKRMALGELPYLDYFDHKPPGIYWVGMVLYKLFGNELMPVRLLMAGINVVGGLLIFIILSQIQRMDIFQRDSIAALQNNKGLILLESNSLLGGIAYIVLSTWYQGGFFLTENFVALLFLITILFLVTGLVDNNMWRWGWLGLFLGGTILFKQTAVLALVAVFVYALIFSKGFSKLTNTLMLLVGMMLPVGALLWWLRSNGLEDWFIRNAILFNLKDYPPYPIWVTLKETWSILMPALFFWIAGLLGLIILIKSKSYLLPVGLMGISMLPILFIRPYHHYWLQFLPFALIGMVAIVKRMNGLNKVGWVTVIGISIYYVINISGGNLNRPNQSDLITANLSCDEMIEVSSYFYSDCKPPKYFYEPAMHDSD